MLASLILLSVFATLSLAGLWWVMNGQIVALRGDLNDRDTKLFALLEQNRGLADQVAAIATTSNKAMATSTTKMLDSVAANTRDIAESFRSSMKAVWTPQEITGEVLASGKYQYPTSEIADDTRWDGTDATDTLLNDGVVGGHQEGIVADPARPPVDGGGFFGIAGLEPVV